MARFGLIFDVDGVIAGTERVNAEASIKVYADLFTVGNVYATAQALMGRETVSA